MNILLTIFLLYTFLFSINSLFVDLLDKKTIYDKDKKIYDTRYRWLFILVGPICFLFIKRIRKSRKDYYYKKRLEHLLSIKKMLFGDGDDVFNNEIIKLKRYLALKKINNNKIIK